MYNNEFKCSIIIPIYNAELTLKRCLDSILAQTYSNFELILVDDGSTDHSPAIIDEYATRDPRMIAIHKQNGGVSSARNAGLEVASGYYIAFVDADDEVRPNWLKTFNNIVGNRDLAIQGIEFVSYEKINKSIGICYGDSNRSLISKLIEEHYLGYLVGKFFRLDIINAHHIRFDEAIRFREDDVFMLDYARYLNNWASTDNSNYIYYVPSEDKKYGTDATDCTEKILDSLNKIFSGNIPRPILDNQAWSVKGAVVNRILANQPISPILMDAYQQLPVDVSLSPRNATKNLKLSDTLQCYSWPYTKNTIPSD